ncbi:MAG: CorA family divalent cation transporter [Candidatus Cloacimonetes bacterium]|nr:CorA family divalent cation transporter [Candidatus Cloacimonadota bacterium]
MIQYFKVAGQKLTPAILLDEAFWVHLDSPDAEEIDSVLAKFDLPEDFITDLQDGDEPSRLEYEDDAMLIILRVPLYYGHRSASVAFATAPLGIIVIPNQVITVSFYDNEILTQFLEGKHRPFNITQQSFISSL